MKMIVLHTLLGEVLEPVKAMRHSKKRLSKKKLHQIRVSIKRARARLNLVRHVAGHQQEITELNRGLKQLNQLYSARRNLDVAQRLLADLLTRMNSSDLRGELLEMREWVRQLDNRQDPDMQSIQMLIDEIDSNYEQLPLVNVKYQDVRKFINNRLGKVCKQGELVLGNGDCIALHNWRKRVKRLFYQLEVLPGGRTADRKTRDSLQKLGNWLGKVHDICFLQDMLQRQKGSAVSMANCENSHLMQYFENQRQSLLKKCYKQFRLICE